MIIMPKKYENVADLPGVGEKTGDKLKKAGFINMMTLAAASPKELMDVASLGEGTADKVIEAARKS